VPSGLFKFSAMTHLNDKPPTLLFLGIWFHHFPLHISLIYLGIWLYLPSFAHYYFVWTNFPCCRYFGHNWKESEQGVKFYIKKMFEELAERPRNKELRVAELHGHAPEAESSCRVARPCTPSDFEILKQLLANFWGIFVFSFIALS